MIKVCLDPGHGGKDPGAVGHGYKEKDLTLRIAIEAGKILEDYGVEVVYTRTSDVYVELQDRAKIANTAKVDSFTSIHINSATNNIANGVETFNYTNSQSGKPLSTSIQDSLVNSKVFQNNRGVKEANFAVLRLTNMPACLVELGFITNKDDVDILSSKWKLLAMLVAHGVLRHHGINGIQQTSIDVSDYAISASKKAVQKGIFADGDNDGHVDNPQGYLTREQLAVVLDRLGLLDD